METNNKIYKLVNLLPFIILGIIFIVGCLASACFSETVQYIVWGIFVAIIVGFLTYIRFKNK